MQNNTVSPDKKRKKRLRNISTTKEIEQNSYLIVSVLGYVIVSLSLVEYVYMLVPPQFLNPNWEMATAGKFVETVWILLLGLVMIFFRPYGVVIKNKELKLLSLLSKATLAGALICFLTVPLVGSNAIRLVRNSNARINAQIANQNSQIETALAQINDSSELQIEQILKSNNLWDAENQAENVKTQFTNIIQERKQDAVQQLKTSLKKERLRLFKTASKYFISAIAAGIAFLAIWRHTSWTRSRASRRGI